MVVFFIVILSFLLQLLAAGLAVRLWRVTSRSPAWLVLAIVALLMAARRAISLYRLVHQGHPGAVDFTQESVGLAISILMVAGVVSARLFLAALSRSRDELGRRTEELGHRIRQLNCLFSIADLVNQPGITVDEVIQGTVDLIPSAWRFPEVAVARILLDGREFRSNGFHEAPWRSSSPILVNGQVRGRVEIAYRERLWPDGDDPFTREEDRLLMAIAERLGKTTERHEAQEQLRGHREELAHASRLSTMGEMASSLAHELNQPLAAIANYVRGCQRRLRSEACDRSELLAAMDAAVSQADRAGRILGSLRDFVARREPRRQPIDINRTIVVAVDLVTAEARVRGTVVRVEPADGLPPVLADAIQIEQVVLNIVRNSLEAISGAGLQNQEVVIRTARCGADMVEVAICDRGPGLPEGSTEKVFEAFFTTKSQGMGIGLSVSRSIIEAHRGRMWAASNPDGGVTFRFTIPVGPGEQVDDV